MTDYTPSRNPPASIHLSGFTVDSIEDYWRARELVYKVRLGVVTEGYTGEAEDRANVAASAVLDRMFTGNCESQAIKDAHAGYLLALQAYTSTPEFRATMERVKERARQRETE
jgi:hypothetical protein